MFKRLSLVLDKFLTLLGVILIVLTVYVAVISRPPVGLTLKNAVLPETVDWLVITTLVGGYITYAGERGLRIFGAALWTASISSAIGASYTSATFLVTNRPEKRTL